MLRKINAVLSLLCTYLLLSHAGFHAAWMLSMGAIEKSVSKLSFVFIGVMALHAITSIILAVLTHKGAKCKGKGYASLNKQTYIQRVSGILLIPFTALHVLGVVGITNPPQLVHAILPPLFFAFSLMHVAVSVSKAFITLGIGNAKAIKAIDIAVKMLCAVTLVADIVGFYLYVV